MKTRGENCEEDEAEDEDTADEDEADLDKDKNGNVDGTSARWWASPRDDLAGPHPVLL